MNYVTTPPSQFENMVDYVSMWRAILIDDMFADFSEVARTAQTWAVQVAPPLLIRDIGDAIDAVAQGFIVDRDSKEIGRPRHLVFSWRYDLGTQVTRADTPLRDWDVIILRTYTADDLRNPTGTLLCVSTQKTFVNGNDTGEDHVVSYNTTVLGESTNAVATTRRTGRRTVQTLFASAEVVNYCGTTARCFLNLGDMETAQYVHLNELLTGRIGDVQPLAQHIANYGNPFIGGYINADLLQGNAVPTSAEVVAFIDHTYNCGSDSFMRFIRVMYDDERTKRPEQVQHIQPMNAS